MHFVALHNLKIAILCNNHKLFAIFSSEKLIYFNDKAAKPKKFPPPQKIYSIFRLRFTVFRPIKLSCKHTNSAPTALGNPRANAHVCAPLLLGKAIRKSGRQNVATLVIRMSVMPLDPHERNVVHIQ